MANIFIDKIIKKFDSEDIIKFSDKDNFKEIKVWAKTGCPELNYNLGVLGFPTGIIEIAGKSKSGKTTLGLMGMYYFQKENPNGICVILSSENRDNKSYAKKIGIKVDEVIIIKVRYMESMFLKVKKLINDVEGIAKEQKIDCPPFYFLWDSLGATLSKSEIDTMEENLKTMEKKIAKGEDITDLKHEKIAAFARPAKMFAKFIIGEMYTKDITLIMLNHQYDKMSGHGRQSTGGEWVELFPCIRLQTIVKEHVKLDEENVGQISIVKLEKNDFGSRKPVEIEILFGYGTVLNENDIEFAVEEGILKREGKLKLSFMNKLSWTSKRTFYELYKTKNPLLNILTKKIYDARAQDTISDKDSV